MECCVSGDGMAALGAMPALTTLKLGFPSLWRVESLALSTSLTSLESREDAEQGLWCRAVGELAALPALTSLRLTNVVNLEQRDERGRSTPRLESLGLLTGLTSLSLDMRWSPVYSRNEPWHVGSYRPDGTYEESDDFSVPLEPEVGARLAQLPNLRSLELGGSAITAECKAAVLRRAESLPNLRRVVVTPGGCPTDYDQQVEAYYQEVLSTVPDSDVRV